MSLFVVAVPDSVTTAAQDLVDIESVLRAAHAAAAPATTSVTVAAEDEVSTAIAKVFGDFGQQYRALSAQAVAFHHQFVQTLRASAGMYALAESANASSLHRLQAHFLGAINARTEALLGRPLIGDGASGVAGTGQAGGAGGLLWGNGGDVGAGADGTVGHPNGTPGGAGGAVGSQG